MSLESRIDDLYKKPLDEFVASRSALASELKGTDAQRVSQLKKPTAVPWAVNQVYWHARLSFDQLQRHGAELRGAQLAALKGRSTELRAATEAHRSALLEAVKHAVRFGDEAGLRPSRDALMRTFEALSLAATPPEPPGRLTHPLQPGGFEMLTGATEPRRLDAPEHPSPARPSAKTVAPADAKQQAREQRAAAAAARAHEREIEAAARRRAAAIKKAEATLASARDREAQARQAWEHAQEELEKAKRALDTLHS